MIEFFAHCRVQNAYPLGHTRDSARSSGGGGVMIVTGVPSVDLLNVCSGLGTNNRIVSKLGNGDRVRRFTCQKQGNPRWCEIGMLTDMR